MTVCLAQPPPVLSWNVPWCELTYRFPRDLPTADRFQLDLRRATGLSADVIARRDATDADGRHYDVLELRDPAESSTALEAPSSVVFMLKFDTEAQTLVVDFSSQSGLSHAYLDQALEKQLAKRHASRCVPGKPRAPVEPPRRSWLDAPWADLPWWRKWRYQFATTFGLLLAFVSTPTLLLWKRLRPRRRRRRPGGNGGTSADPPSKNPMQAQRERRTRGRRLKAWVGRITTTHTRRRT